ncbi:MAG: short-chain dehydrogenase, partial [Rhizobiales bacterium 32-66-8]
MDLSLSGRRVLVTGASKGIGAACAKAFLAEGCSVVLAARDAGRLSATAADLAAAVGVPQEAITIWAGDLSQGAERARLFAEIGAVDILVNNAGAIMQGGLLDLTMAQWDEAWALKVMGYIHLTQLYLGAMKDAGAGTIVNIGGNGGRNPRYGYVCGAAG